MITLHNAIRALNSSVVTIRGDIAYDANEQEVIYSKSLAEAKLAELQAQEEQAEQAQVNAKASALAKLAALGLTQDEVKALVG
jgi:DeoR/GlpR family transcriptional regulator of sugar metabolism